MIKRNKAFTLVELLVVIAIIIILVSMLFPSIQAVKDSAQVTKIRARVSDLNLGAHQYKSDNRYYPGQENLNRLGTLTGSQLLAEALFIDYSDSNWHGGAVGDKSKWKWKSLYASLGTNANAARSDLFNPKEVNALLPERPYSISDRFGGRPLPVLYFVARLGESVQFRVSDNSAYCIDKFSYSTTNRWSQADGGALPGDDQAAFEGFIKDMRFGGGRPRNQDQFLLVAAGRDRIYGSDSNIKNWQDK